jgi:hypothetical protein
LDVPQPPRSPRGLAQVQNLAANVHQVFVSPSQRDEAPELRLHRVNDFARSTRAHAKMPGPESIAAKARKSPQIKAVKMKSDFMSSTIILSEFDLIHRVEPSA